MITFDPEWPFRLQPGFVSACPPEACSSAIQYYPELRHKTVKSIAAFTLTVTCPMSVKIRYKKEG